MHLRSHDDAIEELRRHGVNATRRDWSLGDTVVVPLSAPAEVDDVTTHAHVAWLVPGSSEGWDLVQVVFQQERRRLFASLELAVVEALELAKLFDLSETCAQCGGGARLSFGERCAPAHSTYWTATSCATCGARTEADGAGALPDALRAIELRRHGTWRLSARSEHSPQAWSAIRKELALGLAELAALKRALPGEIFRGTFAETKRLQARLADAGVLAEMQEAAT